MQIKSLALAAAFIPLAACSTMPGASPTACATGDAMVRTELYFGLERKSGDITPKEWNAFVTREIAPRFPEGFTVVDAHGAWFNRERQRTIEEKSKLVIRLHADTPEAETAIAELIGLYKTRFQQESVMRIDAPACAAF